MTGGKPDTSHFILTLYIKIISYLDLSPLTNYLEMGKGGRGGHGHHHHHNHGGGRITSFLTTASASGIFIPHYYYYYTIIMKIAVIIIIISHIMKIGDFYYNITSKYK